MEGPGPRGRLLLVDDDRLVLATLVRGLAVAGFEVAVAADVDAALALLGDEPPDLVILDIALPGRSGLAFATELAERDVPFMFLSALSENETVLRASETAALSYVVKPVDVAALVPAIGAALVRARELRKLRRSEVMLENALRQGREASIATGILMERHGLDRATAFERLRRDARSQRRRLSEVALDVIASTEARLAGPVQGHG